MVGKCPDSSQQRDYDRLVEFLDGDYYSAYRAWRKYDDANPGNGAKDALSDFKRPTSEKIADLKKRSANLIPPDPLSDEHTYTWVGDPFIKIKSMTDSIRGISDRNVEIKDTKIYAKLGQKVHGIFQRIVESGGDRSNPTIKSDFDALGIPESMRNEMFNLYDELSEMGTVLAEQVVYAETTTENQIIAGTADVVVYGKDGKKHIVDLKTTYVTSETRRKGKRPFDPEAHRQQKAQLYAQQTMGYGRMTEMADGQPVTGHFIVPFEIELNVDDQPESGFKHATIVKNGKSHLTNIKSWLGVTDYANVTLDSLFNQTSQYVTAKPIIGDDTSLVYTNLTGEVANHSADAGTKAIQILNKSSYGTEPNRGFWYNGKRIPYKDQTLTDPEKRRLARLQQIEETINKSSILNNDISHGIRAYLMESMNGATDQSISHLNIFGKNADHVREILRPFEGRKNISVINLNTISGFAEKKNWILVEDGKTRHLLYMGVEDLNKRFQTEFGSTSLFGRHAPSIHTKTKYNGGLRNNLGDARRFEGTLIAMKIKEANPDATFGITAVYGLGGGPRYGDMIDIKENLNTIKILMDDPVLRDSVLSPNILELISNNPKFLDYDQYRPNFMEMLTSYMVSRKSDLRLKRGWKNIWDLKNEYSEDAHKRQKMFDAVATLLDEHLRMGKDVKTDYETMLLSQFYLQLQDLDISLLPTNLFRLYGGIASNIANPMLQKLNAYLNNSVNRFSQLYWKDYKDPFRKSLDKFFKARSPFDVVQDKFSPTGDAARHYHDLYKKGKFKVIGTDEEVDLPVMEFVDEGSDEFKALPEESKKLITDTNDIIEKLAENAGIKWVRGRLPLVRADVANRMNNIWRNGGANAYSKFIEKSLIDLEESFGSGDDVEHSNENIFKKQDNTSDSDPRSSMMGMMSDKYINIDEYYNWTSNLEVMMDVFAVNSFRAEAFNHMGTTLKAANSVLQWWKSNLLTERFDGTIDWLNYVNDVNIENHDIGTNRGSTANKATKMIQKAAAIGLYAFNPMTAVTAQIGNELTLTSESIANWLTGSKRFKTPNVMKAKAIIAAALAKKTFDEKSLIKIEMLMRHFRLFNNDLGSILNGYHRTGDKTIMRSKSMFSLLNGGDWITRANVMVAQMLDDGSWDAFEVNENQDIIYDEDKDERFNGKGKLTPEQARALKKAILRENGQGEDEKLNFGYSDKHGNSMRAMSNYLFGATDRESRSLMNYTWGGKLLGGSKNWFVAKYDRYVLGISALGGGSTFDSEQIGQHVFDTDANTGELVAVWKGEHMEGILMSMLAGINYMKLKIQGMENEPLTQIQKNNLIRFTSDMVLLALMYSLSLAIRDDDDETTFDDMLSLIMRRSIDDLLVFYNVITLDDFLWTPVALSWGHNLMESFFRSVYEMDVDDVLELKAPFPLFRAYDGLNKVYEVWDGSKFEITTEE